MLRLIRFYICNRTRFPAPGMIDQKFCIHTEHFIQKLFVIKFILFSNRTSGNISHGIQSTLFQLFRIASSHTPKIRKRSVIPQRSAITHLIQTCKPETILIRFAMLCHDIHRNLCQIQIRTNSSCRRNPGLLIDFPHYLSCKFFRCQPVSMQIIGNIHKNLID